MHGCVRANASQCASVCDVPKAYVCVYVRERVEEVQIASVHYKPPLSFDSPPSLESV
jgi:hypothetical protein